MPNLQHARDLIKKHPDAFDFKKRPFRWDPVEIKETVRSGEIWGVLPQGGVIELCKSDKTSIAPGIITDELVWRPVGDAAHPHIAKMYIRDRPGKPFHLGNISFRPTILIGEPARQKEHTKSYSLLEDGFAVGIIGRSYNKKNHPPTYGGFLVRYDNLPELAESVGGQEGLGYYDLANSWSVCCDAKHAVGKGGHREVVWYRGHTDQTTDQTAQHWSLPVKKDSVEQTARNLLVDLLGLRPEVTEHKWQTSRHRNFFHARGEIVNVCYDRGDKHSKRPERKVPSLVISPSEFNRANPNRLVVLRLIEPTPSDDDGFILPLKSIPYSPKKWSLHPALVRSITNVEESVEPLGTGYRLDVEQPEEFLQLEKRLRRLYG